jgi:hypothetical protein
MDLALLTYIHTGLSLAALAAGIPVAMGLLRSEAAKRWTIVFLVTSVLTSLTGFLFPFSNFGDSHWVGLLSLIVLAAAIAAQYLFRFRGAWRWIYAIGALLAFYFNVFVLVAQLFKKVPALHAAAPTLMEPPFLIAQLAVLAVFVWLLWKAARGFKPAL